MTPTQHALALVVEERARTLVSYRKWFRASPIMRRAMPSLNAEYKAELHALLRLRRHARAIARQAEAQKSEAIDRLVDGFIEPDDWDEPERFEGWREGQPEFNGAF